MPAINTAIWKYYFLVLVQFVSIRSKKKNSFFPLMGEKKPHRTVDVF